MNLFYYLWFIIGLSFIMGCLDYNNLENKKEINELRKNYSELKHKYSELRSNDFRLNLLNERIKDLSKRLRKLEAKQYDEVFLDSSSKG